MTDDEREKWLEGAEYYGDAVENKSLVPVMEEGEIDVTVSFPAVKYDKDPSRYTSAKPEGFRQVYFKTFWDKIMEGYQMAVDATSDLVELKDSTEAARDGALTATTYAENVNAEVNGMTVRITNRNGKVATIDVSFDFYKTYSSVAAMNADIANIPKSRLVSIATNDKTSEENARIYQKRSDGTMIYIADLDQASASAWAEWLNSMKPQIQAAITQAASDHTRATTDHSTATSDHTRAETDHSTVVTATNNANTQANRAKGYNDHPWQIGNDGFIYVWNETSQSMVRTNRMILEFNDLTEEQKQSLIDEFYQTLVFASVEDVRNAINELT